MPSEVHVVEMWLTCDPMGGNALDKFDERWTPANKRKWEVIVFDGDVVKRKPDAQLGAGEKGLHVELNKVIFNRQAHLKIEDDIGPITAVTTFEDTHWTSGGGGWHEGSQTVTATNSDGAPVQWKFDYDGGKSKVKAHVRCKTVTVTA